MLDFRDRSNRPVHPATLGLTTLDPASDDWGTQSEHAELENLLMDSMVDLGWTARGARRGGKRLLTREEIWRRVWRMEILRASLEGRDPRPFGYEEEDIDDWEGGSRVATREEHDALRRRLRELRESEDEEEMLIIMEHVGRQAMERDRHRYSDLLLRRFREGMDRREEMEVRRILREQQERREERTEPQPSIIVNLLRPRTRVDDASVGQALQDIVERIIETLRHIPAGDIPEDTRQRLQRLAPYFPGGAVLEIDMVEDDSSDNGDGDIDMHTDIDGDTTGPNATRREVWTIEDEDRFQRQYTNRSGEERWLYSVMDTTARLQEGYRNETIPARQELMYLARVRYNRLPELIDAGAGDVDSQSEEQRPVALELIRLMAGGPPGPLVSILGPHLHDNQEIFTDNIWMALLERVPHAQANRIRLAAVTHYGLLREAAMSGRTIFNYEAEYLRGLRRTINGGAGGPLVREHGVEGLQYNPETDENPDLTTGPFAKFPEFYQALAREPDSESREAMWNAHFQLREYAHFHRGDFSEAQTEERDCLRERIRVERQLEDMPNLGDVDWSRYSA